LIGQPQSLGAIPFVDDEEEETLRATGADCFGRFMVVSPFIR